MNLTCLPIKTNATRSTLTRDWTPVVNYLFYFLFNKSTCAEVLIVVVAAAAAEAPVEVEDTVVGEAAAVAAVVVVVLMVEEEVGQAEVVVMPPVAMEAALHPAAVEEDVDKETLEDGPAPLDTYWSQ